MIADTRLRLKAWGLWARGGEPALASMFRAILGLGARDSDVAPASVLEVDLIVRRGEPSDRAVLLQVYTRAGSFSDKALALGIARTTLIGRLRHAEWYVHSELDGVVRNRLQSREHGEFAHQRITSVRYF